MFGRSIRFSKKVGVKVQRGKGCILQEGAAAAFYVVVIDF